MSKFSKRALRAATLLLAISPIAQFAAAQMGNGAMVAAPFTACESEQSSKMIAATVSTGKRSPVFAKTNVEKVPEGNYNGIVISPDNAPFPESLNSIRFDYKGSDKSLCFVEYKPKVGSWTRASVPLSQAQVLASTKDGYKTVQLSGKQFGIGSQSLIKRITIAPPPQKSAGRFLADAIYVNDSPVRKAMNSLFFKVADAAPSGPVGFSAAAVAPLPPPNSQPTLVTQFVVHNTTQTAQNVWFTMGAGLPKTAIQTPDLIPLKFSGTAPSPIWNNPAGSLQNYLVLQPGQKATSTLNANNPFISNLAISFGAPNFNCSNASYPQFPQGITLVEFTINTYLWTNDYTHPETLDISENGGNNAFYEVEVGGEHKNKWLMLQIANSLGATYRSSTNKFTNFCLGDNYLNPGVFPYGCNNCVVNNPVLSDNCANLTNQTCNPSTPAAPAQPTTASEICQVNRRPDCSGGLIHIEFNGYDPSTIVQQGTGLPAPILKKCPKPVAPGLTPQPNNPCSIPAIL